MVTSSIVPRLFARKSIPAAPGFPEPTSTVRLMMAWRKAWLLPPSALRGCSEPVRMTARGVEVF